MCKRTCAVEFSQKLGSRREIISRLHASIAWLIANRTSDAASLDSAAIALGPSDPQGNNSVTKDSSAFGTFLAILNQDSTKEEK
jgi:hypothetical protein